MDGKLRITGWIAVALLALGQVLPWLYRSRPPGEVWDSLFSKSSRPNPEWWIWFLAPVIAAFLAARDLNRQQEVSRVVLIPLAAFFITWAGLFLTGIRNYTGFHYPGFLLTFVGAAMLAAVAAMGTNSAVATVGTRETMKLNGKIIGGAIVLVAAIYWWLVARNSVSNLPPIIEIFYAFTFRLFRFADVLWTIAGTTLLYRGIQEARGA